MGELLQKIAQRRQYAEKPLGDTCIQIMLSAAENAKMGLQRARDDAKTHQDRVNLPFVWPPLWVEWFSFSTLLGWEGLADKFLLAKNLKTRCLLEHVQPLTWTLGSESECMTGEEQTSAEVWEASVNDALEAFLSLSAEERSACFFLKDSKLQRGSGVTVLAPDAVEQTLRTMPPGRTYVLQQHVRSPFLLDGHKFEMRFFVLVARGACSSRMRAFVLRDAVVTMCSKKYSAGVPDVLSQVTNYHTQSHSLSGAWDQDQWRHLASEHLGSDLWSQVFESAKACIACVLGVCPLGGEEAEYTNVQLQLFAFDMMLEQQDISARSSDTKTVCKLIEINANPELGGFPNFPGHISHTIGPSLCIHAAQLLLLPSVQTNHVCENEHEPADTVYSSWEELHVV